MKDKRIMIVEDDPFIADDLRRILQMAGYEVLPIQDDPVEALQLISSLQPDLILLDIHLNTGIDGVELAHRIKSSFGTPFIFISANTDAQTLSRVAFTEPQGFISKPYQEADVLIGIQLALHRSRQDAAPRSGESFEKVQFVRSNLGLERIEVENILYLEANDYYAYLHLSDRRILVSTTLGQLVQDLQLPFLVKIHRSYVVNIQKVSMIVGNALEIEGITLPISRSHKEEFLKKVKVL